MHFSLIQSLAISIAIIAIVTRPFLTLCVATIEAAKMPPLTDADYNSGPKFPFIRRVVAEIPDAWRETRTWFQEWLEIMF